MSSSPRARLLSLFMALTLAGCAAGVPNMPIDESSRAATRTVRINPVVAMPPAIDFFGQSQSVAALMDDKLSAEPKQHLTQEMQDTPIDVRSMLASAFATRAGADAGLKVASQTEAADAQVDLVVNRYGFAIAHPGTATLFPIFSVSATMKNAKGQVVWQATELMSAHFPDNQGGHTLDELQQDPQALSTGSDLVAGMLIRNWKGEEAAQNIPGIQK